MKRAANLSKPLADIFRILYCGHCKNVWQMRGSLKIKGSIVERTFECPYCGELVKKDWIKNPTRMAIEPRDYTYPMWNDPEQIKFNRGLLGLDPVKGLEI